MNIKQKCATLGQQLGLEVDFHQSNGTKEMCHSITHDSNDYDGLIINPIGCDHSTNVNSTLFRNALTLIASLKKTVIEVHITNIFLPGTDTTHPLQVPECNIGFISGLGIQSYLLAIKAINQQILKEVKK